jgi:hypothetical protein
MKYVLIILMIMNQLLTRKMKGGEPSILWTRPIVNFNVYKYDFLTILDSPLVLNWVVIYLKLDEKEELVNMYLLLTLGYAEFFGKLWETLNEISNVDDVKFFKAEFKMFHVDTMLIRFFKRDLNAEALYRLENTIYFEHNQLPDEWNYVV